MKRNIEAVILENGNCPFEDWLENLDTELQQAVHARITRVRDGNFGDHKSVGKGVFELRIDKGAGLRVYYGLKNNSVVILLGGGDKSTQKKDIIAAQNIWRSFQR